MKGESEMISDESREKSEKVFKELQKLESTRDGIEGRAHKANEALRGLVLDLLVSERLGPQEETERLQSELAKGIEERNAEKDGYLEKWTLLSRQLESLTANMRSECIEQIRHESLLGKLERKVLERMSGGFSMKRKVAIETNEDGISQIRKIACAAIVALGSMRHFPVSKIEDFTAGELKKMRSVDLSLRRKEVDEFIFTSGEWASSPVGHIQK
jgi:hypothetical protein